jgi:phosphate transport system protein
MKEPKKSQVEYVKKNFENKNYKELAEDILERDDNVDRLKDKIFQELISYMSSHSQNVEKALDLILIARNLERLGDHATNIAEDVIFAVSGTDIRHGGSKS